MDIKELLDKAKSYADKADKSFSSSSQAAHAATSQAYSNLVIALVVSKGNHENDSSEKVTE